MFNKFDTMVYLQLGVAHMVLVTSEGIGSAGIGHMSSREAEGRAVLGEHTDIKRNS